MTTSGIDEEVIRKHLDDVFCKVVDELKEAMGENILNENASWLTHNAWVELGVSDIQMTVDAFECHAELLEAVQEEARAKQQLKQASGRASRAYLNAITTMSALAAKFTEKRDKVQSGMDLFEGTASLADSPQVPRAVVTRAQEDPPKENKSKPNFDPFDVQAVRAKAPQLRSQINRRLLAEAGNGGKPKTTELVMTKMQPPPVLGFSRRQEESSGGTKVLKKISVDGSFTEDCDSTEHDSELPFPRKPDFDDEDQSSFFSNAVKEHDSVHVPSTSHPKAPPVLHRKQKDNNKLIMAPKAPVLRSKAVQDFIGSHTNSTKDLMTEFSSAEFRSLDDDVQKQLTRDTLNKAVQMLNASPPGGSTLMSIAHNLDGAFTIPQCDAVYNALKTTNRIRI